jgi:Rx N-terminal domain/NB-ARC domain
MHCLGKVAVFAAKKVAQTLADGALSIVQSKVTRYRSVKDDVERLKRTVQSITALMADAEERRYIDDETVNLWLCELKCVKLDADILLDEFQTALQMYEHNSSNTHPPRKRKWYQMELPSITSEWGLAQRRRFASEIDKIDKRLEEIAKRRKTLRLRGEDGLRPELLSQIDNINLKLEDIARVQHSMMTRCRDLTRQGLPHFSAQILCSSCWSSRQMTIVGRQKEINEIVELLTSDFGRVEADNARLIPVVPIHGPAGIGKTIVAKMVFNDRRVRVYFDFKAWVTLTDACDMTSAFKQIYQTMTGQRCDFTDAEMLHKLRYTLRPSS